MSRRGVVMLNRGSGPNDTEAKELRALFDGCQIVEAEGDDLERRVRAEASESPAFVGVAGGDGSIRTAAGVLAGTSVALLPVPTGTRNHFARAVGIDTTEDAASAARSGVRTAVDVAEVNGEVFINNSSIGFYAALVRERELHERRMPKVIAQTVAAWNQARHGHRFEVVVDGRRYRAWIVFVGNGCYGENLADLADRESLDAGTLDVRVVRADQRLARVRIVLALILGRVGRSPLLVAAEAPRVEVDLARQRVDVAVDGEVTRIAPPLAYRVRPRALIVLTPPAELG